MAPLEITICMGDFGPGSDSLEESVRSVSAAGSLAFEEGESQGGMKHGASASLRRRAGRSPQHHEWAGSLRGVRGASEAQLGSPGIFGRLKTMRDSGMITNEQCVSLATAAVGIRLGGGGEGSHVSSWRRGEAAEAGDLVAGTPVATFLDREGRTGNTYAIGGNGGQPGAHLDHAAVFQKYLVDKAGSRVGMEVSEQYVGSGGAHERAYYFKNGWGEGNASNYYAIDVASGAHLGGSSNPMTRKQYSDAAIKAANEATPSLGTQ